MEEKRKTVGVLFSGGLDSTYLVWKNLKDGNNVQPIYYEIDNNENKSKLEKNRIELLRNEFNKEFGGRVRDVKYCLKVDLKDLSSPNLCLKQVPVWIFGLVFSQYFDLDEIQIGYVMNDDAISYIKEIKKIYKSFNSISFKNQIPLKFPLLKNKKHDLLNELPEKYKDLIVSCEQPHINEDIESSGILKYKPCGRCDACERIIFERCKDELSPDYKEIVIDNSLDKIKRLTNKWEHKEENNRFFFNVEINDPQPKLLAAKSQSDDFQLEFDFDIGNEPKSVQKEFDIDHYAN